jgi:hypothetical protein
MTEQEFFDLAERFRHTTDLDEASRLGHELGLLLFGTTPQTEPRQNGAVVETESESR